MSAIIAPPSIAQIFVDTNKTGLLQVHSEAWIVDEIGQDAFCEALENRVIVYVHDVSTLDEKTGRWISCPAYGLKAQLL